MLELCFFFSQYFSPYLGLFFSELKWTFVDGSASSGIPKYLENCRFQCNSKIPGRAEKGISVHKKSNLRPLDNRYFCHITNVKWSWISKKSIKKCICFNILILGPLIIEFPFVKLKIYHHRKEKSYRGFWKWHDQGNNFGGCRSY